MAEIVPTILAETPEIYKSRLDLVTRTATRVHVDIVDGKFATTKTIGLSQVYVPEGVKLDLHLMVQNPHDYLNSALALKPDLIIVHAEAEGDHIKCIKEIQSFGVDAGVALLPESRVEDYAELLKVADHALIFTGDLGHYGGDLDRDQLYKLAEVKSLNAGIETALDGGVNKGNADELEADVLYVGSGYLEMVKE